MLVTKLFINVRPSSWNVSAFFRFHKNFRAAVNGLFHVDSRKGRRTERTDDTELPVCLPNFAKALKDFQPPLLKTIFSVMQVCDSKCFLHVSLSNWFCAIYFPLLVTFASCSVYVDFSCDQQVSSYETTLHISQKNKYLKGSDFFLRLAQSYILHRAHHITDQRYLIQIKIEDD